jgi:hypothetical protein
LVQIIKANGGLRGSLYTLYRHFLTAQCSDRQFIRMNLFLILMLFVTGIKSNADRLASHCYEPI